MCLWIIIVLYNLKSGIFLGTDIFHSVYFFTVDNSKRKDLSSGKCELSVGVQFSSWIHNLSNLKEVWRLDCLIQAHTLLAVMTDKTSPEHQLHLLRAYTFALQVWKVLRHPLTIWDCSSHATHEHFALLQVSMAVATEISSDMAKCQPPQSAGSRKDQDKGKSKKSKDVCHKVFIVLVLHRADLDIVKSWIIMTFNFELWIFLARLFVKPTPAEERSKPMILDPSLPSAVKEWARYVCPDQARQIFRTNSNPHCINRHSITKQARLRTVRCPPFPSPNHPLSVFFNACCPSLMFVWM